MTTHGGQRRIRALPQDRSLPDLLLPDLHPAWSTGRAANELRHIKRDDEAGVREPAAEHLRELNCRMLEAADGPTAPRILNTVSRLDLLVTDVGLPNGMNGHQVAEAMRQQRPGLPVCSSPATPGTEVVRKPFDLDTFSWQIQSVLVRVCVL